MNNDFNIEKKKKSDYSEKSFIPNIPIIPKDTLKNPIPESTNNKSADSYDPGKISVSDEPTIFIPTFDERVIEKPKDSINNNKAVNDSSNKISDDNKVSKPVNSDITAAEKKPFQVKIADDGFLSSDSLNKAKAVPPVPPKKKFEVHIEDNLQATSFDEHTPKYNGEVYFSNRKPSRKQPVVQQEEKYSDEKVIRTPVYWDLDNIGRPILREEPAESIAADIYYNNKGFDHKIRTFIDPNETDYGKNTINYNMVESGRLYGSEAI